VGDFAENFVLLSQTGEMVSLSAYCGKVVYISFGALWCGACMNWAQRLAIYGQRYAGEFVPIELMAESLHGPGNGQPLDPPNAEELMIWAVEYQGAEAPDPVLADPGWAVFFRYFTDNDSSHLPEGLLIGRDGKILHVGQVGYAGQEKDADGKIVDITVPAIDEALEAP
jgi:thiol-disulfide isomerase/thioredoxin